MSFDLLSDLETRFLRYVQIDTTSDEDSPTAPSSAKQFDLLHLLAEELPALSTTNHKLLDTGFLIATIPANVAGTMPTIAFFAHVDTVPGYSGTGVKPIVHRNYQGQAISLPDDPQQVINQANSPYLAQKIGHDLVTASGTTLLGADDKAGVAILVSLAGYLAAHPELPHGDIRLCFTTDEEIGRGIQQLDLNELNAQVGYTLDGGEVGEITYETFSGDKAVVTITGVSIHPGYAYGKMVNALHLAAQLINGLPHEQSTPETTHERQGYWHVYRLEGNVAEAKLSFILRDFDRQNLAEWGKMLQEHCQQLQKRYPQAQLNCVITPQYRNMGDWLKNDMRPVELAIQAIEQLGISPIIRPIRGGTDGSQLTEMGLPTPNLFAGMQNIHGPLEWVSLQDMALAVQLCARLGQLWTAAVMNH